jgi:hypothetical protein
VSATRVTARRSYEPYAANPSAQIKISPEGHLELIRWARRWRDRTWALEDCRHLTRRLGADLLKGGRAGGARATQAYGRQDGVERELRLLVDYRVDLIIERTRHQARLRWFLVEPCQAGTQLGIRGSPPHDRAGNIAP